MWHRARLGLHQIIAYQWMEKGSMVSIRLVRSEDPNDVTLWLETGQKLELDGRTYCVELWTPRRSWGRLVRSGVCRLC